MCECGRQGRGIKGGGGADGEGSSGVLYYTMYAARASQERTGDMKKTTTGREASQEERVTRMGGSPAGVMSCLNGEAQSKRKGKKAGGGESAKSKWMMRVGGWNE